MAQARRVKFRFRNASRRWGFSRRHLIVPRRIRFGTRPKEETTGTAELQDVAPRPHHTWPVLTTHGSLEVRIAETEAEIEDAQRLRYHIFYEEMSAIPSAEMREQQRDFDRYDEFCDHLLVVDRDTVDENGKAAVVGTYRLLRGEVAARHGGYYTSSEYDLSTMLAASPPGTRFLELGRSCVLKSYRAKSTTMQLLWHGIVLYLERYSIDVMFGCGSLHGTEPESMALALSYLYHFHRAPEEFALRARPELYVEMNRVPKEEIDPREALRSLPPLVKGYVRTGSLIGDGAVIDRQFGTTDVLIYFPVSRIEKRWRSKFARMSAH